MTLNEYQKEAEKTAIYKEKIVYPAIGLIGEAGEVADKLKKIMRDCDGEPDYDVKRGIALELGDVMWYCAILMRDFGMTFNYVEDVINKPGFRVFFNHFKDVDINYLVLFLCKECSDVSICAMESASIPKNKIVQNLVAEGVSRVMAIISFIGSHYGFTNDEIGRMNIEKLESRMKRDSIKGSGDER